MKKGKRLSKYGRGKGKDWKGESIPKVRKKAARDKQMEIDQQIIRNNSKLLAVYSTKMNEMAVMRRGYRVDMIKMAVKATKEFAKQSNIAWGL